MREMPKWPPRRRRWLGLRLALALGLAAAGAAASPRIVAVGDVHGDLPAFKAILAEAGLVDASGAWIGGDAVLVQLGDLLDRGPSMRGTLDFAMGLEQAAAKSGGRVVTLLGNHEAMNLTRDLRYVAPANWAEFADAGSEKRLEEAWRQVADLRKRRAKRLGQPEPAAGGEAREAWLQAHPAGYLEQAAAFGPDGVYGRWLRQRPALFVAEKTAFLHGGIAPAMAAVPLEEIDRRVHEDLATLDADRERFVAEGLILPFFDLRETLVAVNEELQVLAAAETAARAAAEKAGKTYTTPPRIADRRKVYERFADWSGWTINSSDGPLWFRGYSDWSDADGDAQIPRILSAAGLARVVVGHTIQQDARIHVRFGGTVFLIDTGMNTAYVPKGRGCALEIADGTLTAIYSGEPRQVIWPPPAKAAAVKPARPRTFLDPDGKPLPFTADAELLEFLREAKVVETRSLSEGITHAQRLTLERNGVRAHAVFRTVHTQDPLDAFSRGRREPAFRDFYGFEPAAYRLGLLLGIDNVPPAALRRVQGEPGSIQVWMEAAMTERARRETKAEPPEKVDWQRRLQVRRVWDTLIGNSDRNQGNTLYTPDWKMWLIDHTRAFRTGGDLRDADDIVWCERGVFERLRTVADAEIEGSVRENLKPAEISALLERRRKLVDFLGQRIRERGEAAVLFDWPS
jgi:hypothetical protein